MYILFIAFLDIICFRAISSTSSVISSVNPEAASVEMDEAVCFFGGGKITEMFSHHVVLPAPRGCPVSAHNVPGPRF